MFYHCYHRKYRILLTLQVLSIIEYFTNLESCHERCTKQESPIIQQPQAISFMFKVGESYV